MALGCINRVIPVGAMTRDRDWFAHAILVLGVVLFALPVWLVLAGSTQSSDAITRGDLSLIPDLSATFA